jgi:hypothetical protein
VEAATCADAFIAAWVACFGVPAMLTTDQGRQFTSAVWSRVCALLGVEHITTTAYHPQSNGMVEWAHRQLKDALRAQMAASDWPLHLPWVLPGLRAAPKEDSGVFSAELLYGTALALPGQFLAAEELPVARILQQLRSTEPLPTRPLPEPAPSAPPKALQTATHVYVRRGAAAGPLAAQYAGPYLVLERGPKVFKLRVGDREEAVSVDGIKPHLGAASLIPAAPPPRGQPPGLHDGRSYATVVTRGGYCGGAG